MAIDVQAIAADFALSLKKRIGAKKFEEMRRKNATPDYGGGVCASHDYCDANVVMEASFRRVVGREPDTSDDADIKVWNTAWDVAFEKYLKA